MNKKILVISVLLLTIALLSLPVMGKQAKATKIEGVTLTANPDQSPVSMRFVSHGKILHYRGTSAGPCTLTIPTDDPLNPLVLSGAWSGESLSRGKFSQDPSEPASELLIMGKVTLTFTGGTFEGVVQRLIIGPYPPGPSSYYEDHMVFQGTGDLKGQTLKLSFEGFGPVIDEGYLIIPK